jgi:hypothetical protein
MKESDVQRQILDYLALNRIFHYRNNQDCILDKSPELAQGEQKHRISGAN